jgi:hypothetical protein
LTKDFAETLKNLGEKENKSTEELTGTGRGSWPHRRSASGRSPRSSLAGPLVGELAWAAAPAAGRLADAEGPPSCRSRGRCCAGELAGACGPADGLLSRGDRCWSGMHRWSGSEREGRRTEEKKKRTGASMVTGER